MNRRRFLKDLLVTASALLVAPRMALKHLIGRFVPSGRHYHFPMSWDGSTRRTWIDGEEVFSGSAVIDTDSLLGKWDIVYMLPVDAEHDLLRLDHAISWTRTSDDSPFEPPPRTDPPPVVDGDVGEGEDLVDSW